MVVVGCSPCGGVTDEEVGEVLRRLTIVVLAAGLLLSGAVLVGVFSEILGTHETAMACGL